MELLNALLLGSYVFGGLSFAWAWTLYRLLVARIDVVWARVVNHQEHEIDELKRRVTELESPSKARPL